MKRIIECYDKALATINPNYASALKNKEISYVKLKEEKNKFDSRFYTSFLSFKCKNQY